MTHILLVDDDPDVSEAIEIVLKKEGYSLKCVGSGEEALDWLQQHETDLVITDLIMPGMNGVDLIRTLRKNGRAVRIVAISGGGNFGPLVYQPNAISTTAYLEAANSAGADLVMTKPFERDELCEAIASVMKT